MNKYNFKPLGILFLLYFSSLLTACGGGGSSGNSGENPGSIQTASADNDAVKKYIYEQIITDNRFTDGFYSEPENTGSQTYTIRNLKNHDISLYDVSFAYPLCENDFNLALETSNSDKSLSGNTLLDSNNSNDLYYEFVRSDNSSVSSVYIQRVYKCSTYEVNATNNYKGQYTASAIDQNKYHKFIEYLWYFSYNNNYGNIVISSNVNSNAANTTQTMIKNAKINSYGECDEVYVTENYFDLDNTSRNINQYEIINDIFYAKYVNGKVELCN